MAHRVFSCLIMTLVVSACGPDGSLPAVIEPRFGLEIGTAHGSNAELATTRQLLGLLSRHDVTPFIFTRVLVVDEDAVPHSHPVLTDPQHPLPSG